MINLVLEFASDRPDPVFKAVKKFIAGWSISLSIIPKSHQDVIGYERTEISVEEAFEQMCSGVIISLLIEFLDEHSKMILIHKPNFAGDSLPLWFSEIHSFRYEESRVCNVQPVDGLKFAALCFEDTLDIAEMSVISKATFPWADWRLVEAAVADSDSDIMHEKIILGPASARSCR